LVFWFFGFWGRLGPRVNFALTDIEMSGGLEMMLAWAYGV
jgi:hypothetical protein